MERAPDVVSSEATSSGKVYIELRCGSYHRKSNTVDIPNTP